MVITNIGKGKSIEEAIENAKLGLQLGDEALEEFIHTEVLVYPKKKVLGLFGGCDAEVKATYDDDKPEKKPAPKKNKKQSKPAPKKDNAPKVAEKPVKTEKAEKKPAPKADKKPVQKTETAPVSKPEEQREAITEADVDLNAVCAYVKTIVDSFKVEDANVTAQIVDGVVDVTIECDDYGIIIGRRGETLDAIQYLLSLTIKRASNKYARVTINVGDYRAKREATLKALAIKHASFVVKTGRRYTFEPMNPYERRIIHTAVQEVEGAVSRSVGSGMDRRVVVEPKDGVKNNSRPRRNNNSRPRAAAPKADPNRQKKEDIPNAPKYGKIEI